MEIVFRIAGSPDMDSYNKGPVFQSAIFLVSRIKLLNE